MSRQRKRQGRRGGVVHLFGRLFHHCTHSMRLRTDLKTFVFSFTNAEEKTEVYNTLLYRTPGGIGFCVSLSLRLFAPISVKLTVKCFGGLGH